MRVLWDRQEATVADVQRALDLDRPLAYTTVATIMSRMEEKGLITHRADGRVFYYRPLVSEDGIGTSMVGELIERIFGGSPSELVSHLLQSDQIDRSELDRIKKLIRERERQEATRDKGKG